MNFNQLFFQDYLMEIEEFVGAVIDKQFPEKQLSRTKAEEGEIKGNLLSIYNQLNKLSEYK